MARYKPGQGWVPESLFGPGETHRASEPQGGRVAAPIRAYAVGDEGGAGTDVAVAGRNGLWEPDPATPINFSGNLLGIAFDPNNPARGYAVGTTVSAGAA